MPGIIDGQASGIKTQPIIEKLVELKRAPILRLEKEQRGLKLEIQALNQLNALIKELQASLKILYSFEAAFLKKKATFSEEGYISAQARKDVEEQEYQISVPRLATPLIISSRDILKDYVIPSSEINIQNKKKKFSGGSIFDFKRFLEDNYKDILKVKLIKTKPKTYKIILQSNKIGKKGILSLKDSQNIFYDLEFIQRYTKSVESVSENTNTAFLDINEDDSQYEYKTIKKSIPILFSPDNLPTPAIGNVVVDPNQTSLRILQQGSQVVQVSSNITESTKHITFQTQVVKETVNNRKVIPRQITFGPTESLVVKNIEVFTYNPTRIRRILPKKRIEKKSGYNITYANPLYNKAIYITPNQKIHSISVENDLIQVEFFSDNQTIIFSNLNIQDQEVVKVPIPPKPPTPKELVKKEDSEQNKLFPHLVQAGFNALIILDGVELERDKNKDIEDIIDGVNISLNRKLEYPITFNIEKSIEEAKEQVVIFVEKYNQLNTFIQEVTKSDTASTIGEFEQRKQNSGILTSSSTLRNLATHLKHRLSNPYPAIREPYLKLISMVGISTGKIGSNWEDISQGLLVVDEETLEENLNSYPVALQDFFGIDTNYDKRVDDGFAFTLHRYLEPYVRSTRGILSEQIKTNNKRIVSLSKEIGKIEKKAEAEKEKLTSKFGRMESAIMRHKLQGDFIKSRLKPTTSGQ